VISPDVRTGRLALKTAASMQVMMDAATMEQSSALLYATQVAAPNLEVSGNLFLETTWMLKLTAQHKDENKIQLYCARHNSSVRRPKVPIDPG
jgi:hypothetical protein